MPLDFRGSVPAEVEGKFTSDVKCGDGLEKSPDLEYDVLVKR